LGEWLARLGVTFTDNLGGIVVAMIFVSLPYLVNGCYEAFTLIDRELEMIALTDGATPWQAFWRVALPQARRGVAGSAVMMWARGVSEFGAIIILAYHPKVVPVLVYERFEGFGLAAAQPVALLLIISALVAFFVFHFALSPRNLTG
jgi:molybdate/tungstate transport system permease protein